jgi:hypothetical protein
MTLTGITKVRPYEVVAQSVAGGMGDVYRGRHASGRNVSLDSSHYCPSADDRSQFPVTASLGIRIGFCFLWSEQEYPLVLQLNTSFTWISPRRVIRNPEYCFVHKLPKLRLGFNLAGIFAGFESCHNEG